MPYAFTSYEPSVVGHASRWDVPLNDWMGVKFQSMAHDTAWGAIGRWSEDRSYDVSPTLQPEDATKQFGIPGYLDFTEPVTAQRAALMRGRKDAELLRLTYLNAATHSPLSAKAALGTLAGMAGSVSNPLDLSLMFIPFIGSSVKAAGVSKLAWGGVRQTLARGLVTEERLATATQFPAFSAAVINGTLGNAITEIPVFAQNVRDKAIYGPSDAIANIALGGVMGGAFHVAGKALSKVLKFSSESHAKLSPETHEVRLRETMNNLLADEPITGHRLAQFDDATVREDLVFNEAEAAKLATEEIAGKPGSGDRVIRYESADAEVGDVIKDPSGATYRVSAVSEVSADGKAVREVTARRETQRVDPDDPDAIEREVELQARIEQVREQRINDYINAERVKHEAILAGKVHAVKVDALKQEVKDGKILSDEDVVELTKDPTDEAGLSVVKEHVANLEKELTPAEPKLDEVESPVDAVMRRLVKSELERAGKDVSKAYDAAASCLSGIMK
jgi:hypothetical protein